MNRRVFTELEIGGALRALEAGVRLPEVCARLGVSERTVNRWRREARSPERTVAPTLVPVPLTSDQAAIRSEALERNLEALRMVLHTLLDAEDLERAARLVEARCQVSAQRARRLVGLPPVNARPAAVREPARVASFEPLARELP